MRPDITYIPRYGKLKRKVAPAHCSLCVAYKGKSGVWGYCQIRKSDNYPEHLKPVYRLEIADCDNFGWRGRVADK